MKRQLVLTAWKTLIFATRLQKKRHTLGSKDDQIHEKSMKIRYEIEA